MNILFVSSAKHFGGTERWTAMAAKELERRGHAVWVCCPDLPHAEKFIRRERLVHQYPSSIWDGPGKAAFSQTLETLDIDIIIPVSQRMYFPCGSVARKAGVAVVLRLGIVRLPWRPVIDWFGYGIWPDAIVVNTHSIKRVLSYAFFVRSDRIHVIYNGIDLAPSTPEPVEDGNFRISFLGTVSRRKGVGHLITALSHLRSDARRSVRLNVIGDGPGLERYKRRVQKLQLQEMVDFKGHVDNPSDLLRSTDLFVLLSSREGISNALLEAMNAGVACYTTLVGGHAEFIENGVNAYVAASRSPKAVARDLANIIDDPARQQIGLNGQQTVKKMFSTAAMGDALEQLLFDVLAERQAATPPAAKPDKDAGMHSTSG